MAPSKSARPTPNASATVPSAATIAVLDDDPDFCDYLKQLLALGTFRVTAYRSVGTFLDGVMKDRPSLIVLDVELPGMSGLDLLRVLRRSPELNRVPIVVVSAQVTKTESIVRGLEEGGDEYFAKPFDADLFLARVQGLVRRAEAAGPAEEPHEVLSVGPLRMDITERVVRVGNAGPVTLTHMEFDVLEFFLRNPNRVVTKGVLLQEVWRQPPDIDSRTVEKHIQSMRRKLGAFGESFETIVKTGYIFRPKTKR